MKSSKKRQTISLDVKIKILDRLQNGEGSTSVARSYGINESSVRTIKANETNIRKSVASGTSISSKFSMYTRDSTMESMEKALMIWIEDHNQKRIPLDSNVIKQKSIRIYNRLKQDTPGAPSEAQESNFSASKGWFENFKKRYSLHNLQIKGEVASADNEAAKIFKSTFPSIIAENSYTSDQVFNADETGVFWKKMPSRTYVSKTEKTASGFKAAKDRVTFLFCSNASGDYMMKPLLINRALKPRALKGKNVKDLPVHWMANKKAWMTSALFIDWFQNCFVPEVKSYMEKKKLPFKVLLLLDNAPGHPQNIDHPNVKIVFLPPNTTSLLQPLDQGIISTFKIYYIRRTFQYILDKLDENEALTISDIWKGFTILDCIKHSALAVADLRSSTLNACWKEVWPEVVGRDNVVPTTEEEISRIISLSRSLGGDGFDDMGVDDIEELLAEQEIDEEELINVVLDSLPNLQSESESECNEVDLFTAKNIGEALQLVRNFENKILSIDPNVDRAVKFQRDLKKCYAQYEEIYKELTKRRKQILITEYIKKTTNTSTNELSTRSTDESEAVYISSDSNVEPVTKKRLVVEESSSDSD